MRRLAARRERIVHAARALAADEGLASVQVLAVATRAGIAAGTIYRYFPSKTELVEALIVEETERAVAAMRTAADAAPGPLSALAVAVLTFAAWAAAERRLAWAVMGEALEAGAARACERGRAALRDQVGQRITTAIAAGLLPAQRDDIASLAVMGMLAESLIGPLAPAPGASEAAHRDRVRAVTLLALRAVGVADARARGLVVQAPWPGP